jgi:hypothetical protein
MQSGIRCLSEELLAAVAIFTCCPSDVIWIPAAEHFWALGRFLRTCKGARCKAVLCVLEAGCAALERSCREMRNECPVLLRLGFIDDSRVAFTSGHPLFPEGFYMAVVKGFEKSSTYSFFTNRSSRLSFAPLTKGASVFFKDELYAWQPLQQSSRISSRIFQGASFESPVTCMTNLGGCCCRSSRVAIGLQTGLLQILELDPERMTCSHVASCRPNGPCSKVWLLAVTDGGGYVVFAYEGHRMLRVWDIQGDAGASRIRVIYAHTYPVKGVDAWGAGKTSRCASCCADGDCKVWGVATGECIWKLKQPASGVLTTCLCSLGSGFFATGSSDGAVSVWDAERGALVQSIRVCHGKTVIGVAANIEKNKKKLVFCTNETAYQRAVITPASLRRTEK